jgi:hypothetical protein
MKSAMIIMTIDVTTAFVVVLLNPMAPPFVERPM